MTFNGNIDLGNILVAALLTCIGFGLREIWKMGRDVLAKLSAHDTRIEHVSEVVDHHSYVLVNGLRQREQFRRLIRQPGDPAYIAIREDSHE